MGVNWYCSFTWISLDTSEFEDWIIKLHPWIWDSYPWLSFTERSKESKAQEKQTEPGDTWHDSQQGARGYATSACYSYEQVWHLQGTTPHNSQTRFTYCLQKPETFCKEHSVDKDSAQQVSLVQRFPDLVHGTLKDSVIFSHCSEAKRNT